MLLQALGPMTFDASRLLDTACIAYAHVGDATLRALREEFRPGVLEALKVWFSSDDEVDPTPEGTEPSEQPLPPPRRGSLSPRSPLAAGGTGLPSEQPRPLLGCAPEERADGAGVGPRTPLDDPCPSCTPWRAGARSSPGAPPLAEESSGDAVPRRTRSAVVLGSSPLLGGHRHLTHRVDLHRLAAFVPDMQRPAVRAAFLIAANPGAAPRAAAPPPGRTAGAGQQGGYAETPLALAFATQGAAGESAASRHPDGGATVDLGSLAQSLRRLGMRSRAAADGARPGGRGEAYVPRRFTDGGALLMPSLAKPRRRAE
jgi:hypothetical protein